MLLVEVLNFKIAAGALLKVEETFQILVATERLKPTGSISWEGIISRFSNGRMDRFIIN